ncbi:hypothetical protein ACHAXR_012596 [Thalassiosira sp. AJA248-18]
MSTVNNSESECAACGKQGGENLKARTACKLVKYCSKTCQKAHPPKHKKECKKRAAKLFDEALFKQPPPREDCPICFLQLPTVAGYQSCCGKNLCEGCLYEIARETDICPFCRMPAADSDEEEISMCKKRMEAGDASAFYRLGTAYLNGGFGLQQDPKKALELLLQAAELGSTQAHFNIACIYHSDRYIDRYSGTFTEKDPEKGLYHSQRAAMGGCERSRYNLGVFEEERGNMDLAMKHWMIAAASGLEISLKNIRMGFMCGDVTKAEYEKALRAYQNHLNEVKSDQRDRAALISSGVRGTMQTGY